MSEPIRKPKQTPESYNPKNKPEILNMMEESAGKFKMKNTYQVKAANGGSFIDGVPMLKWGEWKDCTYGGTLALIFDVIGVNTSYEQIMGLSGSCYKAIIGDDWDPSSEMPQVGINCENNAPKALGIEAYCLNDEQERDNNVTKNLDNGFPVLVCGQRGAPEWTVLTGYEKFENRVFKPGFWSFPTATPSESGYAGPDQIPIKGKADYKHGDTLKFFGRTYFDYEIAPKDESYTDNQYYFANQYPGEYPAGLLRFYDRKCEPLEPKTALKVSLETCIKTFEPTQGHYKQGYDAYDVLISGFELDDAYYKAKCQNDQYHIGSLQDARRAAYVYLAASAGLLNGENKTKLTEAAALYKEMLDNLLAAIPYEKTSSVFNGSADPAWSTAQRRDLAAALRKNKELEKEVRAIIRDILDHWDD